MQKVNYKITSMPGIQIAVVGLCLLLASCVKTIEPSYYKLYPSARPIDSEKTIPGIILLGPVNIPDELDQTKIITRKENNQVLINEYQRWSGDFRENILLVMAENLSQLLNTKRVILFDDVFVANADMQVLVNIRDFAGEPGGKTVLKADWVLLNRNLDNKPLFFKIVLEKNNTDSDFNSYIEVMNQLLNDLSTEIADSVLSLSYQLQEAT